VQDGRSEPQDLEELIDYLSRHGPLTRAEARRLVGDVLGFLNETVEQFVRRRHAELQRAGWGNREIFASVGAELMRRRFRAAPLTERQLRRMIYG
jgi:hypothetical protein